MAKLSAHGTELLRVTREYQIDRTSEHGQSTLYRETLSYRSDGKILRKSAFWMTGVPYQADHWYDWGWKLYMKLKKGTTMAEHVQRCLASPEFNSKWKVVTR